MKGEAKDSLSRQLKPLILITLVYLALTGFAGGITGTFDAKMDNGTVVAASTFMSLLGILITFALGFLDLGYSKVSLMAYDKEKVTINDLFAYVSQFVRAFGLTLVIAVKVMLWSLLLFIPGIIAAISYSQSFYIAAENPELGITEVIDESKKLMMGRKMEYFVLSLSFILWIISVPFTLGLAILWVAPYMKITQAAFYRRVYAAQYAA